MIAIVAAAVLSQVTLHEAVQQLPTTITEPTAITVNFGGGDYRIERVPVEPLKAETQWPMKLLGGLIRFLVSCLAVFLSVETVREIGRILGVIRW